MNALLLGGLILAGVTAGGQRPAGTDGPTLLGEEATAIVPIDADVQVVEVRGIKGSVSIRRSEKAGEIRLLSYEADGKQTPLAVDIWSEGRTMRFQPRPGDEAVPHAMQVDLPAGVDLVLQLDETAVDAAQIPGALDVHGIRSTLDVAGVRGSVTIDLVGGGAVVRGVEGSLSLKSKDASVQVLGVDASATLQLSGGEARLDGVKGTVRAETEGSTLAIQNSGGVTVTARSGRLELATVAGADLSLTGTPLTLKGNVADVDIQSDSSVAFNDTVGELHVDGYGASLRGSGNAGLLEVRTHNAEVTLDRVTGPLRIEGDGLKVQLKDVTGDAYVNTRSSDVEVSENHTHLVIDNDGGNVVVRRSMAPIEVNAIGESVRMLDLQSSVELHADAKEAEISWAGLPADKDSLLENIGGDVTVHFPAAGACHIEARSKSGRIDGDMDHLVINPDGSSASGVIGGGASRTIVVNSDWNIQLTGGPPRPDVRP